MKANAVICALDLFGFDQIIMVSRENEELIKIRTNMDNLCKDIAEVCKEYKMNDIQLYGSKEFCRMKIIPNIYESFGTNYDLNKVNIEVN